MGSARRNRYHNPVRVAEVRRLFGGGPPRTLADMAVTVSRSVQPEFALRYLVAIRAPRDVVDGGNAVLTGTAGLLLGRLKEMARDGRAAWETRDGTRWYRVAAPYHNLDGTKYARSPVCRGAKRVLGVTVGELYLMFSDRPTFPAAAAAEWLKDRVDLDAVRARYARAGDGRNPEAVAAATGDDLVGWLLNDMLRDMVRRGLLREETRYVPVRAANKMQSAAPAGGDGPAGGVGKGDSKCASVTVPSSSKGGSSGRPATSASRTSRTTPSG